MLNRKAKQNEFKDKRYILSGSCSFFQRYLDTGFRSKWSGLWDSDLKYLDYYAYKINGVWLSWDNCVRFNLQPEKAIHTFRFKGLIVSETVFVPEGKKCVVSILNIKNPTDSEKSADISLEAAVNIRNMSENLHDRTYSMTFSEARKAVVVKTKDKSGCVAFGVGRTSKKAEAFFEKNEKYKEQEQEDSGRCFVPGLYSVKIKLKSKERIQIPFIFCSSQSEETIFDAYDIIFGKWKEALSEKKNLYAEFIKDSEIRTPDKSIDKAFLWGAINLRDLLHKSCFGPGLYAGLPWFTQFWGRDTFWSLPALINIGKFDIAEKIMQTMAGKNIPRVLHMNGDCDTNCSDANPLFLIALNQYEKSTGNKKCSRKLKSFVKEIIKNARIKEGVIFHDGNQPQQWMDTYSRGNSEIEVNSLWAKALRDVKPEVSKGLIKKINTVFWNEKENYLFDNLSCNGADGSVTINPVVPALFGQLAREKAFKVLDKIKKEFATPYGVRTRSNIDKEYSSGSYHKGSVWGLTTGWAACAMLKYGRTDEGLIYLKNLADNMKEHQLGAISECWDAESGSLLGASVQAWSSAMFITAIDEYLFGIKPNIPKKEMIIEPRIPEGWEFMERIGKRIGDNAFDLKIKKGKYLKIKLDFRKKPKLTLSLILPSEITKIRVGKYLAQGNKIKLKISEKDVLVEAFY